MGTRRSPKAAKRYPAAKKEEALALYVEHGPREASRLAKIPADTISSWARREGLSTKSVATNAAATEAAKARAAALREEIRLELLAKARDMLRRMDAEHIDFKVVGAGEGISEIKQVTFPRPTPTGAREYAVAFGILLDKYRLEMGESTDRRALEHSGSLALQGVTDDELRASLARLIAKLEG